MSFNDTDTDIKLIEVAIKGDNATEPETIMNSNEIEKIQSPFTINDSKNRICQGLIFLWAELKTLYSCKTLVIWSCWWVFASCGNHHVGNYVQNLWIEISPDKKTIYNGAAEAFCSFISKLFYI